MEVDFTPPVNLTNPSFSLTKNNNGVGGLGTILKPMWAKILNLTSYDSITNQMLLMETYEESFGICDHSTSNSPLSLVTHNEGYMPYQNNLYEALLYRMIKNSIPESTGLSIEELLDLPTYKLTSIFRSMIKVRKKELDESRTSSKSNYMDFNKLKI